MSLVVLLLLALASASAARPAAEADVVAAAEAALDGVWADAEVRVVRLSGGAADAAPPLRVRFSEAAPRGRVSAEVETQTADGWESAGWAFLEVAVFEPAPVLTADVSRGEAVADAVRIERVETTALRDVLSADALDATDWTAARSLRAGTVLTTRLVEAPAAAERGDALRVRYERGAVTVTLACEARERGSVGETVRARCAATGATAHVRLTAPGAGDWAGSL